MRVAKVYRTRFRRLQIVTIGLLAPVGFAGCGQIMLSQPRADSLAARDGFQWQASHTTHFDIYVESGSPGAMQIEAIEVGAEASRRRVLEVIDADDYPSRVSIFVVSSRPRMAALIGWETNGTAFRQTNTMCIVVSDRIRVGATHELLHIVATNLWGVPQRWINEGLAVYAAGTWHGHDLHALCRFLTRRGDLPGLADLTGRFKRLPDRESYPAVGSFVRYLAETHGVEAVKTVWEGGARALPVATGLSVAELEAQWIAFLAHADDSGIEYSSSRDVQ